MEGQHVHLATVNLAGASLGALICLPYLRRPAAVDRTFAYLLACAVIAAAAISLEHLEPVEKTIWFDYIAYCMALIAGPLLLRFVRLSSAPEDQARLSRWHWAPLGLFVLYAALAEMGVTTFRQPSLECVAYQFSYSVWALMLARAKRPRREHAGRVLTIMVLFFAAEAAELIRFFSSKETILREIVPITLSLGFVAICYVAYATQVCAAGSAGTRRRIASDTAVRLSRRVESMMGEERPYLESQLTLHRLASRLGVSPHQLSEVFATVFESNFHDYVQRWRIDESKRMLLDPELAHLTAEAIGRRAGFGSRSSFYAVFRERVGISPAEYRGQGLPRCPERSEWTRGR